MRHDSKGKTRDIISMEEYLKKRQAINPTEHTKKEGQRLVVIFFQNPCHEDHTVQKYGDQYGCAYGCFQHHICPGSADQGKDESTDI